MADKRFKDCIVLGTLGNGTAYEMAYYGFKINRAVHDGQTYYKVTVCDDYDIKHAVSDIIDEAIGYGATMAKGGELKHGRDYFYNKAMGVAHHCGTPQHVPAESIYNNRRSGSFYKEFTKKAEAFDWIDEHRKKFDYEYSLVPIADLQKQYRDLWWLTLDKLQLRSDVVENREEVSELETEIKQLQEKLDVAQSFEYKGETLLQEQEVS